MGSCGSKSSNAPLGRQTPRPRRVANLGPVNVDTTGKPSTQSVINELRSAFTSRTGNRRVPGGIVVLPGFASTHLELVHEAGNTFHGSTRPYLWGDFQKMVQGGFDYDQWLERMTVGDNFNQVRPREGFEAIRSMGYKNGNLDIKIDIWAAFEEIVKELGYKDSGRDQDIFVFTYDWRRALLPTQEDRFIRLKTQIEGYKARTGNKVNFVSHSLGCKVGTQFLRWVEHQDPTWAAEHVRSFHQICPCTMGAPEFLAVTMLGLDAKMPVVADWIKDVFRPFNIGRLNQKFARMFQTWDIIPEMMPQGGTTLWKDYPMIKIQGTSPFQKEYNADELLAFFQTWKEQRPDMEVLDILQKGTDLRFREAGDLPSATPEARHKLWSCESANNLYNVTAIHLHNNLGVDTTSTVTVEWLPETKEFAKITTKDAPLPGDASVPALSLDVRKTLWSKRNPHGVQMTQSTYDDEHMYLVRNTNVIRTILEDISRP